MRAKPILKNGSSDIIAAEDNRGGPFIKKRKTLGNLKKWCHRAVARGEERSQELENHSEIVPEMGVGGKNRVKHLTALDACALFMKRCMVNRRNPGVDCPVIILRSRPNTSRRLDFGVRRKDVAAENGLLNASKMQQIALPN
jgi:hypothetical protein